MTRRFLGAALFLFLSSLTGCAGPLGQHEAEIRASRSLRDFCQDKSCGAARLVKSEKFKNRWLVNFETAQGLYTVAVNEGGNTNISVWDKNLLP